MSAIRTKVSIDDLVVEIPLFNVASFMLLPSFYVYTYNNKVESSPYVFLALAYRWSNRCLEVHTMINRGHFILLLLQPPCLLWSPVMFRCILSSNCLTEWFRNFCSLFINDFGWSQLLCVCDKIAAQGKIRAFDSIKGSLHLIILQYHKCIYNWALMIN